MRQRHTRQASKSGCAAYAAPGNPPRNSVQSRTATSAWRTPHQHHSRASRCSSTWDKRPCTVRGACTLLRSGGQLP